MYSPHSLAHAGSVTCAPILRHRPQTSREPMGRVTEGAVRASHYGCRWSLEVSEDRACQDSEAGREVL